MDPVSAIWIALSSSRFFAGFDFSVMISMIGPDSRSIVERGTPRGGVALGGGPGGSVRGRLIVLVGCSFSTGAAVGLDSVAAAQSLLQNGTTLPSRTPTAGARSGSTGFPHVGQVVMAAPARLLRRTGRSGRRCTAACGRGAP